MVAAMRARRSITVVGCHAGGEVGNVVVGGVPPPPGATVFEQMEALRADDSLRRFLLREPRGSVATHANLLVPSARADCDAGYIIMEPTEYPAMSGSNTICVTTVLLETGRVEMHEPETIVRLEAPGGVVEVRAACRDGRCESVEFTNVPCFADRIDAPLEVDGLGTLTVDVAFGGMWYAIADADELGFELVPREARELSAGRRADPPRRARAAPVRASGEPRDRRCQHRPDRRAVAGRRRGDEERGRRRARPARPLGDRDGALGAPRRAPRARVDEGGRRDDARIRRSARPSTAGSSPRRPSADARRSCRRSAAARGSPASRSSTSMPDDPFPEGYLLSDTWPGDDLQS